jgi:hypothetical protein
MTTLPLMHTLLLMLCPVYDHIHTLLPLPRTLFLGCQGGESTEAEGEDVGQASRKLPARIRTQPARLGMQEGDATKRKQRAASRKRKGRRKQANLSRRRKGARKGGAQKKQKPAPPPGAQQDAGPVPPTTLGDLAAKLIAPVLLDARLRFEKTEISNSLLVCACISYYCYVLYPM